VGPPEPVTDSRELPAVTAEDEAGFVHGADLGDLHPDNVDGADDDAPPVLTGVVEEEELPGDDELDALVADIDTEDVDQVGFGEDDLRTPPLLDDLVTGDV